jgi:NAD(P)-dependent dehydrogenase (short-subunit alcohol dehydrogenase family)
MSEENHCNKIAVVTGASSGIGRATARAFAKAGFFTFLVGRREERLTESLIKIRELGGDGAIIPADLTKDEEIDRLVEIVTREKGAVDILVNAAGVLKVGLVHKSSEEDFDLMFALNVRGLWLVSKKLIPLMKDRSNANIIHISSIAGSRSDAGLGIYQASKAAVNTLTKVMAKELAQDKIRVNAIAPGPIDTELFKGSVFGDEMEADNGETRSAIGLFGRMGSPKEVARLALFLASPESDFISGSITSIDGAMGY